MQRSPGWRACGLPWSGRRSPRTRVHFGACAEAWSFVPIVRHGNRRFRAWNRICARASIPLGARLSSTRLNSLQTARRMESCRANSITPTRHSSAAALDGFPGQLAPGAGSLRVSGAISFDVGFFSAMVNPMNCLFDSGSLHGRTEAGVVHFHLPQPRRAHFACSFGACVSQFDHLPRRISPAKTHTHGRNGLSTLERWKSLKIKTPRYSEAERLGAIETAAFRRAERP